MSVSCILLSPGTDLPGLIRLVNTAQVNLTTKTPSLRLLHSPTPPLLPPSPLYLEKETGSCLDLAPRIGEGLRGTEGRVQRVDREIREEETE